MQINTVLKALSHPIRRDIITRLKLGPLTAGKLAAEYDVSKPTMSTHFAALKEADLIYSKREGVTITYYANLTVIEEALGSLMELMGAGNETTHSHPSNREGFISKSEKSS